MKYTECSFTRLGAIALLAAGLGLAGCKSSDDRSTAQQWGDRQVAGGVKKALAKDPKYKYPEVQPAVYEGTVQLSGFVDTPEQRQRAAELAAHAKGVRQVINSIELKPTPTGRSESPNQSSNAPALQTSPASTP